MVDQVELLPCPFCGGAPFVSHDWDSEYHDWHVECEKCFNRTSLWDAEEAAIAKWNTRTPTTPERSDGE